MVGGAASRAASIASPSERRGSCRHLAVSSCSAPARSPASSLASAATQRYAQRLGRWSQLVEDEAARAGRARAPRRSGRPSRSSSDRKRVIDRLEHAVVAARPRAAPRSGGSPRATGVGPIAERSRRAIRSTRRRATWSPEASACDERALERGAGLAATALAPEREAEQPLGRRRDRARSPSSSNVSIACLGDRSASRSGSTSGSPPAAAPALDERARREASLLEAGRGVEARRQERLGLRGPPRLAEEVAELDLDARALARVGDAELERGREPRGAPRRRRAGCERRVGRRAGCSRRARSTPATGAASVKWWASSGRTRVGSAAWTRSSASPTRRCSSARRMPVIRS